MSLSFERLYKSLHGLIRCHRLTWGGSLEVTQWRLTSLSWSPLYAVCPIAFVASRLFSEVVQFVTHFEFVPLVSTESFSLNIVIAALLVIITNAEITEETVVTKFLLDIAVLTLASGLNCVEPGLLLHG